MVNHWSGIYNEKVFPVHEPSILQNVLLVLVHSGEDLHYAIWVHFCNNAIAWAHMEFTSQIFFITIFF
jgi:hypothetical protein